MTFTAVLSHAPAASIDRATGRRKRLLLATYTFPPVGGAGVQRVTKFVKYLPRHGWEVTVLTVANPSVPLFDHSLERDVPAETVIRRSRTWEPGYGVKAAVSGEGDAAGRERFSVRRTLTGALRRVGTLLLQPDPQILWLPSAVGEGKRILRKLRHDAVFVSGPPFSTFLIGAALSRYARIPLVLDYRDEWSLSNSYWENKRFGPISLYVQGRMQAYVVRTARGLLATTRSSAEALRQIKTQAGSRAQVSWIYNGYDSDDFPRPAAANVATNDKFKLVFVGTLWNITSVAPLVEATQMFCRDRPDLAGSLELVFAGRRTPQQAELLSRLRGLPCACVEHSYLDHTAAVELMREADALCLLLADLPGVGRVVPAKLFEYFAAGRPILSIAPQGEMWDLLEQCPRRDRFVPADIGGIAGWLADSVRAHQNDSGQESTFWDASAFDRNNEAKQLAEFLESLLQGDEDRSDRESTSSHSCSHEEDPRRNVDSSSRDRKIGSPEPCA